MFVLFVHLFPVFHDLTSDLGSWNALVGGWWEKYILHSQRRKPMHVYLHTCVLCKKKGKVLVFFFNFLFCIVTSECKFALLWLCFKWYEFVLRIVFFFCWWRITWIWGLTVWVTSELTGVDPFFLILFLIVIVPPREVK